jgi:hypothetical protein
MHAAIGLDELHRDAHAVPGFAHRPFDEMRRTELLADLPDVSVLTLKLEGRGTGDDSKIRHLSERRADFFRQSIGEELLIALAG